MQESFPEVGNRELLEEIELLENQVRSLRYGRRILMNLLRLSEIEKQEQVTRLKKEIHTLKQEKSRYALKILELRNRLVQLNEKTAEMSTPRHPSGKVRVD